MIREEKIKLLNELLESEEKNDIGNLTRAERGEFQQWVNKAIEQEPKMGHWFVDERPESDREVVCSNCEQPIFKHHKLDFDYRPKYCPNCGADMREMPERKALRPIEGNNDSYNCENYIP